MKKPKSYLESITVQAKDCEEYVLVPRSLLKSLGLHQAEAAVDPQADSTGKPSTRVSS